MQVQQVGLARWNSSGREFRPLGLKPIQGVAEENGESDFERQVGSCQVEADRQGAQPAFFQRDDQRPLAGHGQSGPGAGRDESERLPDIEIIQTNARRDGMAGKLRQGARAEDFLAGAQRQAGAYRVDEEEIPLHQRRRRNPVEHDHVVRLERRGERIGVEPRQAAYPHPEGAKEMLQEGIALAGIKNAHRTGFGKRQVGLVVGGKIVFDSQDRCGSAAQSPLVRIDQNSALLRGDLDILLDQPLFPDGQGHRNAHRAGSEVPDAHHRLVTTRKARRAAELKVDDPDVVARPIHSDQTEMRRIPRQLLGAVEGAVADDHHPIAA